MPARERDLLHRAELAPPDLDRLLAELVLLRDLGHRCLIGFPQNRDHLLFSKTTLLHGLLAGLREPFSQLTIGPKNLAGKMVSSDEGASHHVR